ncbi:MAG: FAD-dependent oxidoreductase, partial [Candidatus Electrothrix sp. MAN1_4]|nr:FAD-dependent oxidoreductase [Candidatus Electrothrix sp. MAN1_4]
KIKALHVADGRIQKITFNHAGKPQTLPVHTLIDATGNAAVVRLLNPNLISKEESLAGLIVQLRDVLPNAIQFPQGVALLHRIRKAAGSGELPSECAALWLDSGVRPDEIYIKFNLPASDYVASRVAGVIDCLLTWLRAVPGFAQVRISTQGRLGVRDGGRIRGEYCLTESDIHAGKNFSDAVCRAAWPIEHWHPQRGISLDYLPSGHSYTIPKRSLTVHNFSNFFAVGKCLCAEPRAQASARVVGTCWAMGEGLVKTKTTLQQNQQ